MGEVNFSEEEIKEIEKVCKKLNINIDEFIRTSVLMLSTLISREMNGKRKYVILELNRNEYNKLLELKKKMKMGRASMEKFIKNLLFQHLTNFNKLKSFE